MEEYLIKHTNGGYLCQDSNGVWVRTHNIQEAKRLNQIAAHNIINNSISPAQRKFYYIVPEKEELSHVIPLPSFLNDEDMPFNWEELSESHFLLFRQMQSYRTHLSQQLSVVEQEVCDLQHYIEFFSLDAAKGYKAYRMLRERLQKRRFYKDELLRVGSFLGGSSDDFASGKVDRQIKGLETRKYTPRVLAELFGGDGSSPCFFQSPSHSA